MAREKTTKRASKQTKNRNKRSVFAYPLFIFLLLCTGIFLVGWTLKSGAANIFVTAKVASSSVTDPATITSPASGTHFTSIPITVSGNCPTSPSYSAAYVEIFDNNLMRGTALCQADNTFSLQIDLFPGSNDLTAHVFNSTDDAGPVSSAVTVVYDVPQAPPNTGGKPLPNGPPAASNPLIVKTSFIYKGFHPGDQVEWPIEINGGTAPYAVNVDWGDGNSDLISRTQSGEFNITHAYSQSGGYKNSYTIKVKASDANGQGGFIQFFVIVTSDIKQAGIFTKPQPKIGGGLNWLWIAWPAYAVVLLMTISYALGEREELVVLRKKGLLKR